MLIVFVFWNNFLILTLAFVLQRPTVSWEVIIICLRFIFHQISYQQISMLLPFHSLLLLFSHWFCIIIHGASCVASKFLLSIQNRLNLHSWSKNVSTSLIRFYAFHQLVLLPLFIENAYYIWRNRSCITTPYDKEKLFTKIVIEII